MGQTHYEVLGIDLCADSRQVIKAYRRLARQFHPDVIDMSDAANGEDASQGMTSINEARRVLTDPILRSAYDMQIGVAEARRKIPDWVSPPAPPGFRKFYPEGHFDIPKFLSSDEDDLPEAFADRLHRALSLVAITGDLSPLADLSPDGVWKLRGTRGLITDDSLRHLSAMTGLQVLDLTEALVTDSGLPNLLSLTKLNDLSLCATKITDEGLKTIGQMHSLEALNIAETDVTDEGLKNLMGLKDLDRLDIRRTKIRGPGLKYLFDMQDLDLIHMSWRIDPRWRHRLQEAIPHVSLF